METPTPAAGIEPQTARDVADAFIDEVRAGENWFLALLQAVSVWPAPQEEWNGRRYEYLIAGEAFDWLVLAERLISAAGDLIPHQEACRLLFLGKAPVHINAELFRTTIGPTRHAAHLNFLYGVTVEEALQQANIEEVAKAQQNLGAREGYIEDEAMRRLYDAPLTDLRREFRLSTGRSRRVPARTSLDEHKAFAYWLFKRRMSKSDPARLASDTRKGLLLLERLKPADWQWAPGHAE